MRSGFWPRPRGRLLRAGPNNHVSRLGPCRAVRDAHEPWPIWGSRRAGGPGRKSRRSGGARPLLDLHRKGPPFLVFSFRAPPPAASHRAGRRRASLPASIVLGGIFSLSGGGAAQSPNRWSVCAGPADVDPGFPSIGGSNWGLRGCGCGAAVLRTRLIDDGRRRVHPYMVTLRINPKGIEVYIANPGSSFMAAAIFLNDYEGIRGYEEYRGDLALMYFAPPSMQPARPLPALENRFLSRSAIFPGWCETVKPGRLSGCNRRAGSRKAGGSGQGIVLDAAGAACPVPR